MKADHISEEDAKEFVKKASPETLDEIAGLSLYGKSWFTGPLTGGAKKRRGQKKDAENLINELNILSN